MNYKLNEVIKILPDAIKISINGIEEKFLNEINEIRLRTNNPITVYTSDDWFFVDQFGVLSKEFSDQILISSDQIDEVIYNACDKSIYAHLEDFKNGFLTIKGGHRIGFCGTYTYENGTMCNQKNISSVNIRISRQVIGSSTKIDALICKGIKNILLCGPPQSGKTTVLRDTIRKISNGSFGLNKKVVVIDERGEIAALNNGIAQNDIGRHTDVIGFCKKNDGIINAIRSLSPDIIACDEIGSVSDIAALHLCATCGVKVIATIHCNDIEDLSNKSIYDELVGIFDYFVFLRGKGKYSEIYSVVSSEEIRC